MNVRFSKIPLDQIAVKICAHQYLSKLLPRTDANFPNNYYAQHLIQLITYCAPNIPIRETEHDPFGGTSSRIPNFSPVFFLHNNRARCMIRMCTERRFLRRFPRAVSVRFFRNRFAPRRGVLTCARGMLFSRARILRIPTPSRRRVCTSCATRIGRVRT